MIFDRLNAGETKFVIPIALLLFIVCSFFGSFAQDMAEIQKDKSWGPWQVSLGIGSQMSGIKDEDFVTSNIAPLLNVSVGKWFSQALAMEVGYKGWYFNTISDDDRHRYGFYYGGVILNVKSLFRNYKESCKWLIFLQARSGYFYNYYYSRPNICADLGFSNNARLTDKLMVSLDISAIVGWDIYQGDSDILPGITVGIHYLF
jgi:hypothetical protein